MASFSSLLSTIALGSATAELYQSPSQPQVLMLAQDKPEDQRVITVSLEVEKLLPSILNLILLWLLSLAAISLVAYLILKKFHRRKKKVHAAAQ